MKGLLTGIFTESLLDAKKRVNEAMFVAHGVDPVGIPRSIIQK